MESPILDKPGVDPMTDEEHKLFDQCLRRFQELGFTPGYGYSVDGHYPNHEDWLKAEATGHVYLSRGNGGSILVTGHGRTLFDAAEDARIKVGQIASILGVTTRDDLK
jgi:hypothetical protein